MIVILGTRGLQPAHVDPSLLQTPLVGLVHAELKQEEVHLSIVSEAFYHFAL